MQVIIVEDELMLALALEEFLTQQCYSVCGIAYRRDEAMKLAVESKCDLAILDCNLRGESVEPVAGLLMERGIPIVFVTGYGTGAVPEQFKGYPVVAKPYADAVLLQAIELALGRALA